MKAKQALQRLIAGLGMFAVIAGLLFSMTFVSEASATPIGGKRTAVLSPFTAGVITGDQSPSIHTAHNPGFGFGWDMHGGASVAVYPRVTTTDGAVSMRIVNVYESGSGAGWSVDVEVKVDGVVVGAIRYGHLVNLGVNEGQGSITTTTRLGDTAPDETHGNCKGFPCSGSWVVGTVSGIHAHMEFSKACYGSHGTSTLVNASTGIAMLSQNYGTTNKSACDATELSSMATGGSGTLSYGTDTPAAYNPNVGTFDLRNTNTSGNHDVTLAYGNLGIVPLKGDWDGDGDDTIGVYNPNLATFDLRNSNTSGNHDITLAYGNVGAIPLVGDWNGDGVDTIGVYNPNLGTFDLRNSNTTGSHDITLAYGNLGIVPLVGDWDGNGTDTIGVYNPTLATFDLRNTNTSGNHDITLAYGNVGAKPVVGDWDGDGDDTIGVYNPNIGTFDLRNTNTTGSHDITLAYGNLGIKPMVGDWDGL